MCILTSFCSIWFNSGSDMCSDIRPVMFSDTCSAIQCSDACSDINSSICSDKCPGKHSVAFVLHLFKPLLHVCCHVFQIVFRHLLWHVFWQNCPGRPQPEPPWMSRSHHSVASSDMLSGMRSDMSCCRLVCNLCSPVSEGGSGGGGWRWAAT